jgi:hypothetical protein
MFWAWVCLSSTLAFLLFGYDKFRAGRSGQSRISEFHLLVIGFSQKLDFLGLTINLPPMNSITSLSSQQLRQAADIQERIQSLESELADILGGEIPIPFSKEPRKKKRRMSAAGRAAVAAAARARWARIKGTSPAVKPSKRKMSARGLANIRAGVAKRMAAQGKASAVKPKRKMSAAGREALSLAAKARWRIARRLGKATL